ncbi:Uncharacterised protein [Vibrio cholerae]|nr:Uncharacterised protein [Vibrio cholerae]CSI54215.1 Uncharacterised protein [Vibrio cholerae]
MLEARIRHALSPSGHEVMEPSSISYTALPVFETYTASPRPGSHKNW